MIEVIAVVVLVFGVVSCDCACVIEVIAVIVLV